jgi:hypothetical protein
MKFNFRKFPVYTSIRKDMVMEQDISFLLSDGIYMHVPGVMAKSVALRIYSAEGEVELTQQETAALVEWVGMFSGIIADSVIDYIKKHQ